ncbi:MAG: CU044_2847 family protein [Cyanobacteria bacterium J06648_16]
MSNLQPIELEDDNGVSYTIYVQSDSAPASGDTPRSGGSREAYDITPRQQRRQEKLKANLNDVHRTIKGYALYAIGAFQNLAGAEVEDLKLSFGLQVDVDTGIPMLAKGSVAGDFHIEVTCKFPGKKQ